MVMKHKDKDGSFAGLQVYVGPHIHNRKTRSKIWKSRLEAAGGALQDALGPTTTHAVVDPHDDLSRLPNAERVKLVSPEWLQDTLAAGAVRPEGDYITAALEAHEDPSAATADEPLSSKEEAYKRWLGFWSDEFSSQGRGLLHLMVQATYNNERCKKMGNQPLMAALVEMMKCENAIDGLGDDDEFAVRALKYARTAAAVQACSYTIDDSLQAQHLPYCGTSGAAQIRDILRTGTCAQLEQMRNNEVVTSSSQGPRMGTEGAAARCLFCKLPGVGKRMAQRWFARGIRTFEDLEEACGPGGAFGSRFNNTTITREAHFSLVHRQELLVETMTEADISEMETAVQEALRTAEGDGWSVLRAGGAARGKSSHDCDFVITCRGSNRPAEGAVKPVVEAMLKAGRLWPHGHALFRIQTDRMQGHIDRMKKHLSEGLQTGAAQHNLAMDRFDRFFGMFKTQAGKAKRIDLIFVPYEEIGFGLLGWVGGRQYLRFLRQFAGECCHNTAIKTSMHLNSHGLLVKWGEDVWQVPQDGPPINWMSGEPEWPEGWSRDRGVTGQEDVFQLLRVPYRAPSDRNCP